MTDPYRWIDPWEEINEAHHAGWAAGYGECYEGDQDDLRYADEAVAEMNGVAVMALKLTSFWRNCSVFLLIALVVAISS